MRVWCYLFIIATCLVDYLYGDVPNYCKRPLNRTNCGKLPAQVYTFYRPGTRCELQIWRGCPTINKFDTEAMCTHTCIYSLARTNDDEKDKNDGTGGVPGNKDRGNGMSTTKKENEFTTARPTNTRATTSSSSGSNDQSSDIKIPDNSPGPGIDNNPGSSGTQVCSNPVACCQCDKDKNNEANLQIPKVDGSSSYLHYYKYFGHIDRYLKIHQTPMNWNSAWRSCREEGGWLMSPASSSVKAVMIAIIRNQIPCGRVHTAIHRTNTPRDFYTTTGQAVSDMRHVQWNFETKSCPVISGESVVALHADGTFGVGNKKDELPFICEAFLDEPKPRCKDEGYEEIFDGCYKFNAESKTWADALKACNLEGGYLPVLENRTERDLLYKLYEKNKDKVVGATDVDIPGGYKGTVFLGYNVFERIATDEYEWMGIFGSSNGYQLQSALSDCPYYFTDEVHRECGTLLNQGDLAIGCAPCDAKLPFICKKRLHDDLPIDDVGDDLINNKKTKGKRPGSKNSFYPVVKTNNEL